VKPKSRSRKLVLDSLSSLCLTLDIRLISLSLTDELGRFSTILIVERDRLLGLISKEDSFSDLRVRVESTGTKL
jgi:hypothetical protein